MTQFSHINAAGHANMVDVSDKQETKRVAVARSRVALSKEVLQRVRDQSIAKGDLLATARIAGIQAAKKCSDLIPLCHPLPLDKVEVDIDEYSDELRQGLEVTAQCTTVGKTGVEMEALTAVSVAALTIYDMCKALDKSIVIEQVKLLEKRGGKSGNWVREEESNG